MQKHMVGGHWTSNVSLFFYFYKNTNKKFQDTQKPEFLTLYANCMWLEVSAHLIFSINLLVFSTQKMCKI